MTSHPKDLSDELIDAYARLPKLCHHLHLPVQSGDDEILKRMNRQYTQAQYLALVNRLRVACPDIALTTDIIVGFPGESEKQFGHTLDLVREVGFDGAFTFRYSPREGTPAAKMKDQVPDEEKRSRLARLNQLLEEVGEPLHKSYLGREVDVLVEKVNDRYPEQLTGKTSTAKTVNFIGPEDWIGRVIKVKITKIKVHTLFAESVERK
jgi:tRNA-2-methylthio-N6-dimethylallyladenosine synthase